MRRDIDRNPERIKAILQKDSIRKSFLENASRQQSTVAFVASNKGNALKTKPKVSGHFFLNLVFGATTDRRAAVWTPGRRKPLVHRRGSSQRIRFKAFTSMR